MDFSFDAFVDGSFDYDPETKKHTCLWLRAEQMDIGGGKITVADIDKLKDYPDVQVVRISGLCQDTLEYFIQNYGKRLNAISFFKNKFIEDWSPLGLLSDMEYLHFFANQRINSLWDMRLNHRLTGLCIEDFTRLKSIDNIQTAPPLKDFRIGNAIWSTMTINSFLPLAGSGLERLSFTGKSIADNDFSFLADMPKLKEFDFPANMLSTERVAWIAANFPDLKGYALRPTVDVTSLEDVTETLIVGKRKPLLKRQGNEKRIEKYVHTFEALKRKYKGVSYKIAFPDE